MRISSPSTSTISWESANSFCFFVSSTYSYDAHMSASYFYTISQTVKSFNERFNQISFFIFSFSNGNILNFPRTVAVYYLLATLYLALFSNSDQDFRFLTLLLSLWSNAFNSADLLPVKASNIRELSYCSCHTPGCQWHSRALFQCLHTL